MGAVAYICPEKIELCTRGFRIPPSLNPHPRALSADLVLGLFFSGVAVPVLARHPHGLTKVAKIYEICLII